MAMTAEDVPGVARRFKVFRAVTVQAVCVGDGAAMTCASCAGLIASVDV